MKQKKLSKKNKIYLGILLGLILVLFSYLLIDFIKLEIERYKSSDNSTRLNDVLLATFNKDIKIQRDVINEHQVYTNDKRIYMSDLIYDFAKFEYIPILNYLNDKSESENLINGFNNLGDFITDFHITQFKNREDIVEKNSDGTWFKKDDNKYTYIVKKTYIGKEEFNRIYLEYLNNLKYNSVEDYFIDNIYKILKGNYNYDELRNKITNNYDNFYKENQDEIITIISEDITNFADYCKDNYIKKIYDKNGDYIGRELIKDIDIKEMKIEYVFTRVGRVHESFDKYRVYSYQLDLNHLWEQLDEMNLPMFYC